MSNELKEIYPNQIWRKEFPISFFGLKINTNMTIIRLSDDRLWVHSPVPLNEEEKNYINSIGCVAFIVAPNLFHHIFLNEFVGSYPDATVFAPKNLKDKVKSVPTYQALRDAQSVMPHEILAIPVKGIPFIDEYSFYHEATKTLIFTDLIFAPHEPKNVFYKFIFWMIGINQPVSMTRLMKMMIKNKQDFRSFIKVIEELEVETVFVSHERVLNENAKSEVLRILISACR